MNFVNEGGVQQGLVELGKLGVTVGMFERGEEEKLSELLTGLKEAESDNGSQVIKGVNLPIAMTII